tara:strand:+ start:1668 stop:2333 length:666 start_codon:yes stop_codon:yes gene_type:complete
MSDYSEKYVEDKRGYIFIGGSDNIVKFKPFVKNLNYDLKFNDISVEAGSFTEIKLQHSFKTQEYNISFDVVAVDTEEAIKNHKKFQTLQRIITPFSNDGTNKIAYFKFANLIHGGDPKLYEDMSYQQIQGSGLNCSIIKLDYKPDYNMGFFETKGLIFAKAFAIDLQLNILSKKFSRDTNIGNVFGYGYTDEKKVEKRVTFPGEKSNKPTIIPEPQRPPDK